MYCPRCKVKMKLKGRSYHKQRKWVCPRCGRAKMERERKLERRKENE